MNNIEQRNKFSIKLKKEYRLKILERGVYLWEY